MVIFWLRPKYNHRTGFIGILKWLFCYDWLRLRGSLCRKSQVTALQYRFRGPEMVASLRRGCNAWRAYSTVKSFMMRRASGY